MAQTIVLLHGFAMGRWAMRPIARALRAAGYRVVNLTYPSRRLPLEELAGDWLPRHLRAAGIGDAEPLHFVSHSMGGLFLRLYRRNHPAAPAGRTVMIAPPNAGSEVVDHLRASAFFRWFAGRNGLRLGTSPGSLARTLGPWPAAAGPLGVIAGDHSLNPLFGAWIGGPNDGKVSVRSTRLEGMSDHCVLPHSHTWLCWRRDTIAQVLSFLRTEKFRRD